RAPAAQVPLDRLGEFTGVDGFLQKSVASDGEARVAVALGRDGDDGHAAERRFAAQSQRHFVAVEPGQVQVDEDEVGPFRAGELDSFETVDRLGHRVAGRLKQLANEKAVAGVVFDVGD